MKHRAIAIALERRPDGTYHAEIPVDARGVWCLFATHLLRPVGHLAMSLDIFSGGGAHLTNAPLDPTARLVCANRNIGVTFVPADAHSLRLSMFGASGLRPPAAIACVPLSRCVAAILVGMRHPCRLTRALLQSLLGGQRNILSRLRFELSVLATSVAGQRPYSLWVTLYDSWTEADLDRLLGSCRRREWPEITVLVCHGSQAALTPTLNSIETSRLPVSHHVVGPRGQTLAPALKATASEYIALLQAGEVLAPHALPLLADQAVALGRPEVLYADEDQLTAAGTRTEPLFKPEPSRTLMLSGTLTRGVWLVRRDLILGEDCAEFAHWAEALRLSAWLRLWEAGRAASSRRIPAILTHRRPDIETAPSTVLASVVSAHIERTELPARVETCVPLRVRFRAPRAQQAKVSIIVPSACRSSHVLSCLTRVLQRTDYASFEVLIVISTRLPLDARQQRLLERLGTDSRMRHTTLEVDQFNYARANNYAAQQTDGRYICLLNDDVAPMSADWLATMVGHLADPRIGIVGARLYYPDRTLQHGGVVVLPSGTGEHINRFLRRGAAGYASRAILSQEVSAVTGACMLVRHEVFEALGGLDESYASAYNDVDFCLRAREKGWGVVLAAEAELWHQESLSFGRHYTPEEAARGDADRARMHERWASVCPDDPFYNPNLSVNRGDMWNLAFPPRVRFARS
jgi:O-antigen biosynthesis protein